jgi:tetratricopeptide (TPR) repeat protein
MLGTPAGAELPVVAEARKSFNSGDYGTVIAMLTEEIAQNPGHEEAYILLARTYEKKSDKDKAIETWEKLRAIAISDDHRQEARLGLLRTRGPDLPDFNPGDTWDHDPYKVDVGEIEWDRLASDVNGITVQYVGGNPPELHESAYFSVLAATSRAAEAANQLCEKYTEFLLSKYFIRGQEWALRIPIIIYKNHADYVQVGGHPASSAGVTYSDRRTGVPIFIALYLLDSEGKLDREALEGTLPHELTHMVINEYFGGQNVPRWLNEGMARRMEQTRNHYEEAAKVGRDAIAGEYYGFRELFAQKVYPHRGDRTWRFYEQSATIVLFLLEQGGPDSAAAFLDALRARKSEDEAAAGALGIPVEGAVEEFERRWAEWVTGVYLRYRERLDGAQLVESKPISEEFPERYDIPKTVEGVAKWYPISTDSMDRFKDVGGSSRFWTIEQNRLVSSYSGEVGSLIGIRTDEEAPMVLRCKVRWTGTPGEGSGRLGIAMLDHRGDDTGVQVMAELRDRQAHRLTCMVTRSEIAVYLDDVCTGRARAFRASDVDEDIDWPLAFVAYSPVEIYDVDAGMVKSFKPVAAEEPAPK